ncbi:MAG: ABC transporter [Novosphingobium sp.]
MPRVKRTSGWIIAALLVAAMAGLVWWSAPRAQKPGEPLGLFTTLPILWSESPDLSKALSPDETPHWARDLLIQTGPIEPLDMLSGPPGQAPLDRVRRLVMAQPRVLGPQENVALDTWVRGGGQLLLLADPALTEESAYPLTDPRRPQAVVLLSPILGRWGLDLRFDDSQQLGEVSRAVMGVPVPVNLPGHFMTRGQANCRLWADGLAVTCAIGKGRVVALADAAVLERDDPDGARAKALQSLLDAAFAAR